MAALAAKSAVALGRGGGGGGGGPSADSRRGTLNAGAMPLLFEVMEWSWLMCVIVFCPVIGR